MLTDTLVRIALVATSFVIVSAIGVFFFRLACWMYNRVNNVRPPGLGKSNSADYSLLPQGDYHPPTAFSRYDRSGHIGTGLPVPPMMRSTAIIFCAHLAGAFLALIVGVMVYFVGFAAGANPDGVYLFIGVATLGTLWLVTSGAATVGLPTHFNRGLAAGTTYTLIWFMLLVTAVGIFLVIRREVDPDLTELRQNIEAPMNWFFMREDVTVEV